MNDDWSLPQEDVLLKGTLTVVVRDRDGGVRAGQRVALRGCGFG